MDEGRETENCFGSVPYVLPTMMDIGVRKATLEDSKVLYNLHAASVESNQCRSKYNSEYIESKVRSFNIEQYTSPILNGEVLVAVKEETIVGFGSICAIREANVYKLQWLFVHPNYFGKGIGSKLLCELEKLALLGTCASIEVGASFNAFSFYEKRGYKTEKTLSDRILMRKIYSN